MSVTGTLYKLLVVDVDGTLVGSDWRVPVENKEALAGVRRAGITVSLSTGRIIQSCLGIIEELSLDGYHMFYDGALVSSPGADKEVYAQPLKPHIVKQAVEFSRANGIYLELFSTADFFTERDHWSLKAHREFFRTEPTMVNFDGLWDKERIIKAELVLSSEEEMAQASAFQEHFKDGFHFSWAMTPAYPDVRFVNIVNPGVSKGKALKALASHLGILLSETMVVGDGTNDISLLSHVGLAVAMGNAPDEVKAVAHHVTLDVEHNGLAAAIGKFLL